MYEIRLKLDADEITDELEEKVFEALTDEFTQTTDGFLHASEGQVFLDLEKQGSFAVVLSELLVDVLKIGVEIKELTINRV